MEHRVHGKRIRLRSHLCRERIDVTGRLQGLAHLLIELEQLGEAVVLVGL